MRIAVAVLLSLFAVNLYAGKPTNPEPPSEPQFVGYSTGTLTLQKVDYLWVEAAHLCKDTFGADAFAATSDHMKEAINSGNLFPPIYSVVALFWPADMVPGASGNNFHYLRPDLSFGSRDDSYTVLNSTVVACAQ